MAFTDEEKNEFRQALASRKASEDRARSFVSSRRKAQDKRTELKRMTAEQRAERRVKLEEQLRKAQKEADVPVWWRTAKLFPGELGRNLKQLAKDIPRDTLRTIAGGGAEIGRQGLKLFGADAPDDIAITPKTKGEKFFFGEEPIKPVFTQGTELAEDLGASERTAKFAGPPIGIGLFALEAYLPAGKSALVKQNVKGWRRVFTGKGGVLDDAVKKSIDDTANIIAKEPRLTQQETRKLTQELNKKIREQTGTKGNTFKVADIRANLAKAADVTPAKAAVSQEGAEAVASRLSRGKSPVLKTVGSKTLVDLRSTADALEANVDITDLNRLTRDVVTDEEAIETAANLGLTKEQIFATPLDQLLLEEKKIAVQGITNAEKTRVVKLEDSIRAARKAGKTEEEITDLLTNLASAKVDFVKLLSIRKGIASETGRALRAERLRVGDIEASYARVAKVLADPKTPDFAKKHILQKIEKFDGTPGQMEELMNKLKDSSLIEKWVEFMVANLLWNPATHAVNLFTAIGNLIVEGLFVRALASAIDAGMAKAFGRSRTRFASDLKNEASGITEATHSWGTEAAKALRDEDYALKRRVANDAMQGNKAIKGKEIRDPDAPLGPRTSEFLEGKAGISVEAQMKYARQKDKFMDAFGKLARVPFRALGVGDVVVRTFAENAQLSVAAGRIASKKHKYGTEAWAKAKQEVMANPGPEIVEEVNKYGDLILFQRDLPGGEKGMLNKLNQMRQDHPTLRIVIPFMRTLTDLVRRTIEFTPGIGMLPKSSGFRRVVDPKTGKKMLDPKLAGARRDATARMALGTMTMIPFITMRQKGEITMNAPTDPDERDAFWAKHPPYSIKIGDTWYPFNRFSPFADIIIEGALVADAFDEANKEGGNPLKVLENAIIRVGPGMMQNFADKTFAANLSDFLDVIANPTTERGGEVDISNNVQRITRNIARMTIPSVFGLTARTIDPVVREQTGWIKDSYYASIPGLSDNLRPKLDVMGQPITRKGSKTARFLSPVIPVPVMSDPVRIELDNIGYVFSYPQRRSFGEDVTDEEFFKIKAISGRLFYAMTSKAVLSPTFQQLTNFEKEQILKKFASTARQVARENVVPINKVKNATRKQLEKAGVSDDEIDAALERLFMDKEPEPISVEAQTLKEEREVDSQEEKMRAFIRNR